MQFKIDRPLYVIIGWPESQIIPQFLPKYFDKCLATEGTYPTYAVPVEIWNKYLSDEDSVISRDNEE